MSIIGINCDTVDGLHGTELSRVYNAVHYGALVDGSTNDSAAWISAIDACTAAGGGRVTSSKTGISMCQDLKLKDNVELHVPAGLTLKLNDGVATDIHLVRNDDFASGNDNISITGEGLLDGNAANQTVTRNITSVQMQKVTNLRITVKKVTGGIAEGVYVFDSPSLFINSECTGNGDAGEPDGSGLQLDTCSNARVFVKANNNGFHGVLLSTVVSSMIQVVCDSNNLDGLRSNSSEDNTIIAVCNNNTSRGLYLNTASVRNTVHATIRNNSAFAGLTINDSNDNQCFVNTTGNTGQDILIAGTSNNNNGVGNWTNLSDTSGNANNFKKLSAL